MGSSVTLGDAICFTPNPSQSHLTPRKGDQFQPKEVRVPGFLKMRYNMRSKKHHKSLLDWGNIPPEADEINFAVVNTTDHHHHHHSCIFQVMCFSSSRRVSWEINMMEDI